MTELFQKFRSLQFVHHVGINDFSDKLSFLLAPAILSACCSLVTVRTYIMHPLACYLPVHYSSSKGLENYVNSYCWTEGTYAVPASEFSINNSASDGGMQRYEANKIGYYQWIPFLLALQASMCYLPRVMWHLVSFDKAGTDLGRILKTADSAAAETGETHDKLVVHVCRMILNLLRRPKNKQMGNQLQLQQMKCGGWSGQALVCRLRRFALMLQPAELFSCRLILFYLLIKLLYIMNAVGQVLLMQRLLSHEKVRGENFGLLLMYKFMNGKDWHTTMHFPRVGVCAIYFRAASHGNWMMAQCSLPVNMINEKLYIFLWFWFVFLASITAISMIIWLWRLCNKLTLTRFVRNYFKLADNYAELKKHSKLLNCFVSEFLGRDGAFLLRMISLNCGDVICSKIVHWLWSDFKEQHKPDQKQQQQQQQVEQQPKLKRNCGILDFNCDGIIKNDPSVPAMKYACLLSSTNDCEQHNHDNAAALGDGVLSFRDSSQAVESMGESEIKAKES